MTLQRQFLSALYQWQDDNPRPLPWKYLKDPYLIWLSEIMLQQTRAEQVIDYFKNFRNRFPTIFDLAAATEDEILKLWQGLGYYSRARNLHHTARYIVNEFGGNFPCSYTEIRKLKGIGDYSAAAIASFAFGKPHVVVDGNVIRVLARYFGIRKPVNQTEGRKAVRGLAEDLLDKSEPARFNQVIMDFGALHCKPKAPLCSTCPLSENCIAFLSGSVDSLPVKTQKAARKKRYFNYLLINCGEQVYFEKRREKDIWRNLYQFPLIETNVPVDLENLKKNERWKDFFKNYNNLKIKFISESKQVLTHREIRARFYFISNEEGIILNESGISKVHLNELSKYAVPGLIHCFLKDNFLTLYESTKQKSYKH